MEKGTERIFDENHFAVLLELIVFHMSEDSLFDELRSWPWSVEAV
jgi:hypothetical protein